MKTTSIPLFKLRISFLWLFLLVTCHATFAQTCIAPNTNFSTSATDALCLGSGTVTVSGVAGGSGSYEYQLVHSTNSGLNKPWQTTSSFTSVSSGVYQAQVRSVCTSGTTIYSSVVSQQVTVGGNYETLDLSVNTTPTCGTDGTITTTATKGYLAPGNGYRYALVPSLNEPEPIGTYVRPQQSSNVFSGLAPGTYYVRVYDDCSSYASYRTIQAIVTNSSAAAPGLLVQRFLTGCNSESFEITSFFTTVGSLSFVYPDGTETPLVLGTGNVIPITTAKFGTGNPVSNFSIKYTSPCGVVTSIPYVYDKLELTLTSQKISSNCSTSNYGIYLTGHSVQWPVIALRGSVAYTYTIDGGASQQYVGQGFNVQLPNDGNSHTIVVTACGITETITQTTSSGSDLTVNVNENNLGSCVGKSGFSLSSVNNRPFTTQFLSVPPGQTVPAAQSYPAYDNLLPGNYVVIVSDSCDTDTLSFTLSHPYQQAVQVTESLQCTSGQSGIDVNVTTDNYLISGQASIHLRVYVYDGNNNYLTGGDNSVSINGPSSNTLLTKHFALSPGTYKIVVYKALGLSNCSSEEHTITITGAKPITLSQLLATSFCPTQGFTVVQASGGVGPYQYTLYENSIAVNNRLAGPQSGNAFTGLDPNKTYFVAATDACGAGINIQTQFSTVPLTTALNADTKDCLGQPVQLEVYSLPGATYQWYKNNSPIPGANSAAYQIASLSSNDLGAYKVFVTVGSCDDFTTDLTLTGTNCSVLPVKLSSFTVQKEGSSVSINWSTASEENSDEFEIQHSANGRTWQLAGSTLSKGTVSGTKRYSFSHTSPLNGINYYRLKMIDKDGSFSLSSIRSIAFEGATELAIYPNPTSDKVTIKYSGTIQISSIAIYNANGRQVFVPAFAFREGSIDLKQLPAGSYIFKIGYATGVSATHKVTIIR